MPKTKIHWKAIIIILVLLAIVTCLWPRPISSLSPKNVPFIMISTTDFQMENGLLKQQTVPYKFDTEEEIDMVLDVMDRYNFHYTPKKYVDSFLSAVFAADYKHGDHGEPELPELLHIDFYDESLNSTHFSTWGDGYLEGYDKIYYRIGYFGKQKSVSFFKDIASLLTEEYKMKPTTVTNDQGGTTTHWE